MGNLVRAGAAAVAAVAMAVTATVAWSAPAGAAAPFLQAPNDQTLGPGMTQLLVTTVLDDDSDPLEVTVNVTGGTAGNRPTFTLKSMNRVTVTAGSGTNSESVAYNGDLDKVQNTFKNWTINGGPAEGTFGLTITVDDVVGPTVGNTQTDSFTITVASPPGAPAAPTGVAGPTSAIVSWTAPADLGDGSLLQYRVTSYVGGVLQTTGATPGLGTSLVVDRLANGSAYTFTVAARSEYGWGPESPQSAPVTPRAYLPFANGGAMTDRMYADLLGRAPTSSERTTAATALNGSTKTAGGLVMDLRVSSDHITHVDPVTRLYRAYFLRIPDPGGLEYWIGRKRAGTSLNSISQSFAGSSEFKTRYGSLSNQAFVELVYQNVLGRPGEPSGVAFWTNELNTGKRSRGSVMTGFSESAEYKNKQQEEVAVSVFYILLLGRAPTSNEFIGEVGHLEGNDWPAATMVDDIVASLEYRDLVT